MHSGLKNVLVIGFSTYRRIGLRSSLSICQYYLVNPKYFHFLFYKNGCVKCDFVCVSSFLRAKL